MINISLLLRTAGKYPSIQVRERSAWVRDFPDVPRSCLDASGIPDWWKAGICVREIATGVGSRPCEFLREVGRHTFWQVKTRQFPIPIDHSKPNAETLVERPVNRNGYIKVCAA